MEIYNERIKDLLTTEDKNPDIVEDKKVNRILWMITFCNTHVEGNLCPPLDWRNGQDT